MSIASLAILVSPSIAQPIFETLKLSPNDPGSQDYFGYSVAVDQNTVLIGAPNNDDRGASSGSAYLFDAATGQQLHKLTPDDGQARDFFGGSVAIDSGLAIIGAIIDGDNGPESGSAYIYDAQTGQLLHKLTPDDGATADHFGAHVAISANLAAIVATGDDETDDRSGSVYIYNATTGYLINKIRPADTNSIQLFGTSLSIDQGIIAVGALITNQDESTTGVVYLIDALSGQILQTLSSSTGSENDKFGQSVSINNTRVIVGAYRDDQAAQDAGAAYLFDTATGNLVLKLFPTMHNEQTFFGWSVAIDRTTAVVGSVSEEASLFRASTGFHLADFLPSDQEAFDRFGDSVAIDDRVITIGARLDDNPVFDSGSAYIYDLNCPPDLFADFTLDLSDIISFFTAYSTSDPLADFTQDGQYDFFDIAAFLNAYTAGCP